jgi:hypothetical protein
VARKRRPRRRRKQSATPLTRISSLLPSTGILGSLPEESTHLTRCSRSRAPITRVPSSTPLRSATCSGVTSSRRDPRQKVARTRATTRRGRQGRGVLRGPRLLHDLRRIGGERLGSAPQAGAPGGLLGKGSGASLPGLVRQAHHLRPRRPPRLCAEPRKVPLVVDLVIGNARLTKVLMDGGSSLNIIYAKTLGLLGIDLSTIRAGAAPFHGIVPGKRVLPLGQLDLPIFFGTPSNFRRETLTFEVVGFRGTYHAVLGRPCYAKFMAVPNYTYLKLVTPQNPILGFIEVSPKRFKLKRILIIYSFFNKKYIPLR